MTECRTSGFMSSSLQFIASFCLLIARNVHSFGPHTNWTPTTRGSPFVGGRTDPPSWQFDEQKRTGLLGTLKTRETLSRHAVAGGGEKIDKETLSKLRSCQSGTAARRILNDALRNPTSPSGKADTTESTPFLYDSICIPAGASVKPLSDAELALQTGVRGGKFKVTELIETNGDSDADRASAFLLGLVLASSGSAILVNQSLQSMGVVPEIVRFALVWALSFVPFVFVGAGIAVPDFVQGGLVSIQRLAFPSYRRRMVQHEAGHFLLGHLCGMPIRGYRANAVKNAVEFYPLADPDVGVDRARMLGFDAAVRGVNEKSGDSYEGSTDFDGADRPFFSEGGRGDYMMEKSVFRNAKNTTNTPMLKLPSSSPNEPRNAWPFRGFDAETLDKLAIVSMAGVCAEILGFGNAEGGCADLSQLRQLFASAEPELTDREIENRIRFAIGYGMTQLRRHLGALDALAEVMERDGGVDECILAMEMCESVSGGSIVGDYEQRRKEKLAGSTFIERIILSGGKNAADVDQRIEGKGGGERRGALFQMVGDDPLYAALGAASIFFIWASNGGLSLH